MIQDKNPNINLIEAPKEKEKPEKVEYVQYFDQDIAWLWRLMVIKEAVDESKR
jgi:hypothetical protein